MEQVNRKKTTVIIVLLTFIIVLFFITDSSFEQHKNKSTQTENGNHLETVLKKMEGVGEVEIFLYYGEEEKKTPLSNYFSNSSSSPKTGSNVQGVLVVAEGASNVKMKNELIHIFASVLQVPEHRIVIVEMKDRGMKNENK